MQTIVVHCGHWLRRVHHITRYLVWVIERVEKGLNSKNPVTQINLSLDDNSLMLKVKKKKLATSNSNLMFLSLRGRLV